VTLWRQRSQPARVTTMGARLASSVAFATEVHTIEMCQAPRSRAKISPARIAGMAIVTPGAAVAAPARGPIQKAHAQSSGAASATRQKALATGPVSERRTKIGAKPMAQPPARRHANARPSKSAAFMRDI
jgi:hypothetical protein